jgi:hypothetical protein
MARWEEIHREVAALDVQQAKLHAEAEAIRKACAHPKLPFRQLGTEYRDTCPDCGYVSYCYRL